jgi:hypothetical protein
VLGLGLWLASAPGAARPFPDLIALPANFGPEGIAVGNGSTFFAGSLNAATLGQILVGDLRTGEFSELVAPTGRPAIGLKYDARSNLLLVAGGGSGRGTVYDATTGEQVASYQFQSAPTFINDVIVTRDAAYFTDSSAPFLYRVPLGPAGQPASNAEQIPMPATSNGIAATPSGKYLITVDPAGTGQLYLVETSTYSAVPITVEGGDVRNGDGLLLEGHTLYVVQNRLNRVAVVEMSPDYLSGRITRYITEPFATDPALKVPTTIARFGDALYAVTAGFAPPAPDFVVRLSR